MSSYDYLILKGEAQGEARGVVTGATKERNANIRNARLEGFSIEAIARIFKMQQHEVTGLLKQWGLEEA